MDQESIDQRQSIATANGQHIFCQQDIIDIVLRVPKLAGRLRVFHLNSIENGFKDLVRSFGKLLTVSLIKRERCDLISSNRRFSRSVFHD
ncbi:MAG: hypothetical protein C0484_02625 [Rhodospirillum sp.]|nr:hypothetical protein [Rhodospirillum sp.]